MKNLKEIAPMIKLISKEKGKLIIASTLIFLSIERRKTMLPKKIKSIDFDGNEREETYYFNITEAEMADMALSKDGGLEVYINRIIEAKSVPELKELFKFFID